MLPLLGLLYVLVPYYNQVITFRNKSSKRFPAKIQIKNIFQITEEYDEEEDEWGDEEFDYNALNLERRK